MEDKDIEKLGRDSSIKSWIETDLYKYSPSLVEACILAEIKAFSNGYKAAQGKQFTREDVEKAIEMAREKSSWVGYDYTEDQIFESLSKT